jgi:uncharacterized protein (DUF58 family)
MRPTLRGVGVLAVAVAATLVGTQFGQRGLAAIAAPLFVALAGAVLQVRLTGTPEITRSSARRGFVGGGDTVSLEIGGSGIARLTDARPEGVGGPATVRTGLPATVQFDLTYEARGEHRLGPVEVTLTDALGLVVTTETVDATDEVLVYPPVYRLGGPEAVLRTFAPDEDDQQTFDRLREYVPGDSLRDVHWKSSAKRDELLVREFDERADDPVLLVAARAKPGEADAMATAAATVAVAALGAGFGVELATPGGTVTRGFGDAQRTRVLEALARTSDGESGREADADIVVSATEDGVTVTVDEQARAFESLTASRENPLAGGRA